MERQIDNVTEKYFEEIKNDRKKLCIFIDHANIFHNLLAKKIRMDYQKFFDIITKEYHEDYEILKYAYMAVPHNSKKMRAEKKRFIDYFESLDVNIIPIDLLIMKNGKKKQKGLDVIMHDHITLLAGSEDFKNLKIAFFITGDGDLVHTIKTLIDMNICVSVFSFRKSCSKLIKEVVGKNNLFYIDDILDKITIPHIK